MLDAGMTKLDAAALKVIDLAKALVLADNHFLSAAIGRLKTTPGDAARPFSTDGHSLIFNAGLLCDQFKQVKKAPRHDLLHTVLHCVFLHPYVGPEINERLWNLACDIAVERNVCELCGPREGSRGRAINDATKLISGKTKGTITAEKIYHLLKEGEWADSIAKWEAVFAADGHSLWYEWENAQQVCQQVPAGEGESASLSASSKAAKGVLRLECAESNAEGTDDQSGQGEGRGQAAGNATGDSCLPTLTSGQGQGEGAGAASDSHTSSRAGWGLREVARPSLDEEKAGWSRVAKALAVNLQTYSKARGESLSGLVEELEESTRERVDYADFLRQFAIPGEVLRVSDEEFDYIFYTYGLKLYDNLPLIEPLEYREEKRIREFVIVIDTSGSVQGNIVRRFIDATFDILKSTEAFFECVHVRIIQCDAKVQSDDVITNLNELKEWGRTMKIYGGGGTDFRPAFAYVDKLVEDGAFENLGGLVYFTDGWGDYPEWMPDYKVAFVFYDESYRPEVVPTWAAQIVLDERSMATKKGSIA